MRYLLIVMLLIVAACGPAEAERSIAPASTATPRATATKVPATPTVQQTYRIEYKVTRSSGTGGTGITYSNGQGGTEQRTINKRVWTKSYTVEHGFRPYISAQNRHSAGSIKCEIFVNGEQWRVSESSGGYTIATCSGSVGRD